MIFVRICLIFIVLSVLVGGCALLDEGAPKKNAANGLIATPATYYSTAKAKYLGTKYKDNVDRIVERIVRNSKTAPLQFANNISSVGGIGFFTHSATKTPDERYLEVVLATPETFETKGEYSEKIHQLFSRYGFDLLSILSGDSEIYQDRELSGYGLNLAWRNVLAEGNGSRVTMARAIIYFPKERVRSFLREEIKQNDLLNGAVIFGEEENGPLALVSYQPQTPRPDFRPAIREDNLAATPAEPKSTRTAVAGEPAKETAPKAGPKPEIAKKETAPSKSAEVGALAKAPAAENENKPAPIVQTKSSAIASQVSNEPAEGATKTTRLSSEPDKSDKPSAVAARKPIPAQPLVESKPQPSPIQIAPSPAPMAEVKAPIEASKVDPAAGVPALQNKAQAKNDAPSAQKENKLTALETKMPGKPVEAPQKNVVEPQKPAPVARAAERKSETKNNDVASTSKENKLAELETNIPAKPVETVQKPVAEPQKSPPAVTTPKVEGKVSEVKTAVAKPEPVAAPKVAVAPIAPAKSPEPVAASKSEPAPVVAEVKRIEKSAAEVKPVAPTPIPAKPLEQIVVRPVEPMGLPAPERAAPPPFAPENKSSEPAKAVAEIKTPPATTTKKEIAEEKKPQQKPAQAIVTAKAAPALENKPAEAAKAAPEGKAPAVITAKEKTVEEKKLQQKPATEIAMAKPAPAPITPAPMTAAPANPVKTESPAASAPAPVNVGPPPAENKPADKPAGEQLALVRKTPIEIVPENKALSRPLTPKALEGFIIQLAFQDKEKARSWAENMERRGYAVSITEAGTDGALRVRLGNFAVRDEAERQLRNFKQQGISGIIINLPQAFRPEARSSIP